MLFLSPIKSHFFLFFSTTVVRTFQRRIEGVFSFFSPFLFTCGRKEEITLSFPCPCHEIYGVFPPPFFFQGNILAPPPPPPHFPSLFQLSLFFPKGRDFERKLFFFFLSFPEGREPPPFLMNGTVRDRRVPPSPLLAPPRNTPTVLFLPRGNSGTPTPFFLEMEGGVLFFPPILRG